VFGSQRHVLIERLFGGAAVKEGPGHMHAQHRDLRSGGLRATIFGVSDGLVSNVSLVLGTAGAHPGGAFIRLAGLAGLLGGSFSMAAGEYVSMRAQQEAFQRELEIERQEIKTNPGAETSELSQIYVERGMTRAVADQAAEEVMADPETALDEHAREELGIDPSHLGSPIRAGLSSFASFAVGALLPLIPYLGGHGGGSAVFVAIALTGIGALLVGALLSLVTERPAVTSALRSLLICAAAGAATYGIGAAIGVAGS
jgi:VIT1/CCC1 family predicted Fe2+/Mn2+ transporter